MIKFFSRLKRRKGFTLTEMIVVTAIIGIIMATVVAFADPMRKTIRNTEARSNALTINEVLGKYIEHNLAYANQVAVFVGYDYDPTNVDIEKAYDEIKANWTESNDTTKVMIFHFVEPDDDAGTKGGMEMYDSVSTSSSLPALDAKDKIFVDDFYGGYQYFVTVDDSVPIANERTKKAVFNLRIDSYNCDENSKMLGNYITGYYDYVDHNSTENTLEKNIGYDKIGTENVSFTFENIKVSVTTLEDLTNPSKPIYTHKSTVPMETIKRSSTGHDLVIVYNVRRYNVS